MSGRKGERGAVLVAVLMVLALLSLLGAGSMLSASLDTQATGNQKESRLSFYAAEAALDYAVDRIVRTARDPADPSSVIPDAVYVPDGAEHPVGTIPGLAGSISDQYDLSYIVELLPGQTEPTELSWSTTENAQALLNYARGYVVTGIATLKDDSSVKERVKETVRILRRPLTQYLAFYEGGMNWRPQVSTTVSGGRIHSSNSIYLAPANGINFTDGGSVFAMTASGEVRRYEELQESGSVMGTGGGGITVTTDTFPTGKELADHVYAGNQATMEDAFMIPVNGRPLDSHIRVGVDAIHAMKSSALVPDPNLGFYNILAAGTRPPEPGTDCIYISGTNPDIILTYWPPMASTPVTVTITGWVDQYDISTGSQVTFNDIVTDPDSRWPLDALINPDGSLLDDASTPIPHTIVYSVENPPTFDHDFTTMYAGGENNPDYPTRLGILGGGFVVNDPREGLPVEFTVVDLQRLECWYRDFLIENGYATGANFPSRKLLVYATRTGSGALQAIKVIGSRAGRWRRPTPGRDATIRQQNETALVPTTFVTDLPLYIEGDFSTTNSVDPAGAVTTSPGGKPIVVIADSVTLLSNSWGVNHHKLYTEAVPPINVGTWPASYSAAFFTGRHEPGMGGSGPAEGVENLLRLMENWSGLNLYLNGSFNSLWYSSKAVGEFDESVFVHPANYQIGWNTQFGDLRPEETPPYVPSAFLVERESWQEH